MSIVSPDGKAVNAMLSLDQVKDELLTIGQELGTEVLEIAIEELSNTPGKFVAMACMQPHPGFATMTKLMHGKCEEMITLIESIIEVVEDGESVDAAT